MTYQVGALTHPLAIDPKFSDEKTAIDHARTLACSYPDIAIAVWVWDEACNVVVVFLCRLELRPA